MSRTISTLLVRLGLAASVAASAVAYSAPASAAPAFTLERATIGGGLRFATEDLNLGLGVRGGYTLDMGLYIGGLADYWFGESEDSGAAGFEVEAGFTAWDLMVVGGYDAGLTNSIVLRPFGGFGVVGVEAEACTRGPVIGETCVDESDSEAGAVLGVEALFELGESLHIGPEIRIMIFDETVFAIGGNIGGTF